ncbi:MAG: rhodanese-like domain-containing protein [Chloroflexi bacterium]|nr:rhodanese-like domain-containing protein [Chloroflexota bacterium]
MKRIVTVLSLFLVVVLVLGACGKAGQGSPRGQEVKVEGGAYRDIGPNELKTMLGNKDFLLVNVHIPYAGEIEPTDLFVPYNAIEPNLGKLPTNKGSKIVLYCQSGAMSAIAAKKMVKLGYKNIWNLKGGMGEWRNQGNEIIGKPR